MSVARLLPRLALVALVALLIAACGSSNDNGSSGSSGSSGGGAITAKKDPQVAALVPQSIRSKGTLTVAADATYPPNEFFGPDGKTVVGMDADLANALTGVMGLKAKVVNASFDGIIPGLKSGKYDLGMSSFTDTKEREAVVNFVTYFEAGTSFYVKAQGGANVRSLSDLCGKTVAVEKGTTQQTDAQNQSQKCTSEGKQAVNVLTFPDQNGANLALSSGRAQVGMADSPVADYQVKQSNGQFKISGEAYGKAPYGIAIPQSSAGLPKAIQAGMTKLIADGTYLRILKKWGIQDGAIKKSVINGAFS